MQTVEFKHETGKKVTVNSGTIPGTVDGNYISKHGVKRTLVEYYDKNNIRQCEYFDENDVVQAS